MWGIFFQKLAKNNSLSPLDDIPRNDILASCENDFIWTEYLSTEQLPKGAKSVFGVMFRKIRLHHGVTQRKIAEITNYNLRNLLNVETGKQEPGIMVALAMVSVVIGNVGSFFDELYCVLVNPIDKFDNEVVCDTTKQYY